LIVPFTEYHCSASIASPLNLVLFSLFCILLYQRLRSKPVVDAPIERAPVKFRTFTPTTLLPHNGKDRPEVFLAVKGKVFDVSSGRNFYGPGGPYENFAGRDASRGLASGSFDEGVLTKDLEGPLDDLQGLNVDEREALEGWEERFDMKYPIVGKLVSKADFKEDEPVELLEKDKMTDSIH